MTQSGGKMKKLAIDDKDIMQLAIQQEISRSEESKYDHRLHGVLLVSKGFSCYETAEMLGQSATTIQRWIKRFNKRGFAALYEGERKGRPKTLDKKQWASIERDLRKQPRDFGYGQNLWDGKMLSHHLKQRYGVSLGVRQCQRLFRQMGFRRRKPRPVIAQADPAAQTAYKKTPPTRH